METGEHPRYECKALKEGEWLALHQYKEISTGAISEYANRPRGIEVGVKIIPLVKPGPDSGFTHTVLIANYRVPVQQYVLEFPAGILNPGEGPIESAARELKEETGYTGTCMSSITPIVNFTDPWKSNDQGATVFFEIDLSRAENAKPIQELDASENIRVYLVPFAGGLSKNVTELAKTKGYRLEQLLTAFMLGFETRTF